MKQPEILPGIKSLVKELKEHLYDGKLYNEAAIAIEELLAVIKGYQVAQKEDMKIAVDLATELYQLKQTLKE